MLSDKKIKKNVLLRAAEMFDLPAEVMVGVPKLELTGNQRMHIEGHNGVFEYSDALITINGGEMLMKIYGAGLEIASMNAEELLITGNIHKFEFE